MKIEVKNPNKIVESAFISKYGTKLATSVMINIKERGIRPDCVGSGQNEKGMEESIYYFYAPDISAEDLNLDTNTDVVMITAESEEDNEVLRRWVFELHCKTQLWFMYCDKSVFWKED